MKKAFTLLEVMTVLALLSILVGASLWGLAGTRERELREKVKTDLARIDSAKAAWRVDHPQLFFPTDEAGRFAALQTYLTAGLQVVTNLADLYPNAMLGGVVLYNINEEMAPAGATNSTTGAFFNRSTADWQ